MSAVSAGPSGGGQTDLELVVSGGSDLEHLVRRFHNFGFDDTIVFSPSLVASFRCGLVRKVVQVDALAGFGSETLLLLPIGLGYLVWCEIAGGGAFLHPGRA